MTFLDAVRASLCQFAHIDEVSEVMAISLTAKKNTILYGPAGHGKSQMAMAVLKPLNPFVMSFGEGLTEDKLYGGIDFAAMNRKENPVMQYNAKNSFVKAKAAIFEEFFDAPRNVLLSLKDTLTAKCLRAGHQQEPMETEVIFGLTNKNPAEMRDLGPAEAALLERFPLQFEVAWPTHSAHDYKEMFTNIKKTAEPLEAETISFVRERFNETVMSNHLMSVYLGLLESQASKGTPISPRTAKAGVEIVRASAASNGRLEVLSEDLVSLKYVGFDVTDFREEIRRRELATAIMAKLGALEGEILDLRDKIKRCSSPIPALQCAKEATDLALKVAGIAVTDDFVVNRKAVAESAKRLEVEAVELARKLTK